MLTVAPARAGDAPARHFYHGYDYGSQSLVNPVWVFVNRGYDVIQLHLDSRRIFLLSYGSDARNVGDNLFIHPFRAIAEEGRGKFLREEIFPVSYTRSSARWPPNYALHLLGGGMTYTMLREWSEEQGLSKPWGVVIAASTILASAYLNETLENSGVAGRNTDAIADFWVFDVGGMLLFSFDGVNRFFSRTVVLADWSQQPSFTLPAGELHNQGNYFSAKYALPFYDPLRLFVHFGMGTLGGLSYELDGHYSVSAAAGYKVTRLENKGEGKVENAVTFAPSGGVFVDRNDSLLASLQVSNIKDYMVHFNLYPNAVLHTDPGIGLWTAVGHTGEFAAGLSWTRSLGIGVGYSNLPSSQR